jgi:hypothetical protein
MTAHSICQVEGCGVKILPNTPYCPIHTALREIEARDKDASERINTIFDTHRIPYEGIYEPKARKDLLELIHDKIDEELERVQTVCENSDGIFAFTLANAIEDRREELRREYDRQRG